MLDVGCSTVFLTPQATSLNGLNGALNFEMGKEEQNRSNVTSLAKREARSKS